MPKIGRAGFDRSDFTGSEGPGLARLRAAKPAAEAAKSKAAKGGALHGIVQAMREGRWPDAILGAAKFPDLGDHAAAIHRGREAILRPAFQRQLRRDPAAMIEEAQAALLARWPL